MSSSLSSAPEASSHGVSTHCLNCGALLAPQARFCHACGQDTANHPPSLLEFVHEFVAHYVALEGALWRSLKGLALKPGFLTQEYLAGRKARYVLPLRLLLTLGFVFFLTVKLDATDPSDDASAAELGEVMRSEFAASAGKTPTVSQSPASATFNAGGRSVVIGGRGLIDERRKNKSDGMEIQIESAPTWLRPQLEAASERWAANAQTEYTRMMGKVRGLMPYAVLCSLPFFAGILSLVFWWRRLSFGAHFVFAMHLHAFFYLGLILLQIPGEFLTWPLLAWIVVYPLLAIKRVYAQRWLPTLGSGALVFCLHATLQILMFITVFAIGALAP